MAHLHHGRERPAPIAKALFAGVGLLVIGLLPHAVHASQDRFGGVFHGGKDPHNLLVGMTWNELADTMKTFGQEQQKLIDVEIIQREPLHTTECSPPTFAGVWREGTYGQSLIGGLTWKDFRKQVKLQKKHGMNMIDLETHLECGIRKFVGVFSEGAEHQKIEVGMTWRKFTEKYAFLHEAGWHLIDIETYDENASRYWAAVWNKGYRDEWLWVLPRAQFEALQEDLDGTQQLVDMESWRDGRGRWIAGLFYGSSDSSIMETGENWPKFVSFWEGLSDDDNRLVDLEVYPDTTDRRWEDTFHQALHGKAMGWSFAVMESGMLAEAGAEGWARSPLEFVNPSTPMDPASVMNVASVTKMLTVVGTLKISEQIGSWFLNMPFAYYLHADYDTYSFGQGVWDVTIRDLMTQKTCMQEPDIRPLGSTYKARIGAWLKMDLKNGCTPGTGTATYYNHYFNLLIMVIEAITGQNYETWMNNNVFSAVGIGPLACGPQDPLTDPLYYAKLPGNGLGISLDPPGTSCFDGPDGMGGAWYASSVDMARFIASFREGTILQPPTVQMMESEVMAWYWNSLPEVLGQKNGGICDTDHGVGIDVMALVEDFDVAITTNSWTAVSCDGKIEKPVILEDLIIEAYHAPEDW